jgi:cell division protein FtsW (lipid II flippase)
LDLDVDKLIKDVRGLLQSCEEDIEASEAPATTLEGSPKVRRVGMVMIMVVVVVIVMVIVMMIRRRRRRRTVIMAGQSVIVLVLTTEHSCRSRLRCRGDELLPGTKAKDQ